MINTDDQKKLSRNDIEEIVERIKPTMLQTTPENREDLRQNLYEISIKTLKKIRLTESKGLFL